MCLHYSIFYKRSHIWLGLTVMIAVIYYMITKGWGSFKNTTVYFKAAFTLKCMAGRRGYLGFTIYWITGMLE